MCVLIFCTISYEIFPLPRRIHRHNMINVHRCSSGGLFTLVIFYWNSNFLNRVSKNIQMSSFMKIFRCQVSWKSSDVKFHENLQMSSFMKIFICQFLWKSTQWDPSCSVRSDMKKATVACCNFATALGNNKDIMTLSPDVDVIVCKHFVLRRKMH